MKKHILVWALVLSLLLSACGTPDTTAPGESSTPSAEIPVSDPVTDNTANNTFDVEKAFSARDLEASYDESKCAHIYLNGDSVSCSSDAVRILGTDVTIIDEGTYVISGTLNNGTITVNADKTDKTRLVLDNASIHSEDSAAILILQADKVFLTLAEGSANVLSNGGSFASAAESGVDAALFSKEDLTVNGSGSLVITSPAGHAIVSKDDLVITGGTLELTSSSHAIAANDSICIVNTSMTITSDEDGIHAENDEDSSLGYLYIRSGTFDITAEYDGLSAGNFLRIDGGAFRILTGGGSENGRQSSSDGWGSMGGGMGPGGMRPGGMGTPPGGRPSTSDTQSSAEESSTSSKGIKAASDLDIFDGTFVIDSADDALHSNSSITVSGGSFEIKTGDDGFHADETLTIAGGTVSVSESYEGLEGLHILVSGGTITLVSTDDGLNAAGGTDASGMGGIRGGDRFGSSSNGSIVISGGTLDITASGDGIDANGSLTISGGFTAVTGPTVGDTATLDYDTTAVISGGTFIGTGGSMMAQTFSSSTQGVIAVSASNQTAGTRITLTDEDGNVLLTHTPKLDFAVIILSTPDLVSGEPYTITVGSVGGTFEAN